MSLSPIERFLARYQKVLLAAVATFVVVFGGLTFLEYRTESAQAALPFERFFPKPSSGITTEVAQHMRTHGIPNLDSMSFVYPAYDDTTLLKMCNLMGYRSFDSKYYHHFSSCSNDTVVFYHPGSDSWTAHNGCSIGGMNKQLRCFDPLPACSNNLDDDGDGKTDMQDPGCTGANDPNETDPTPTPTPTVTPTATPTTTPTATPTATPTITPTPLPLPVVNFSANTSTAQVGTPVTLMWSTQFANGCFASGAWSGDVGVNGSATHPGFTSPGQRTFILTCFNATGSTTRSVTVDVVSGPTPTPTPTPTATPTPTPTMTPTPTPTPTPHLMFSCSPRTQHAFIGQPVTIQEDPFEGHFNAQWSAPEGNPSSGFGRSFSTTFSTVGTKTITAVSADFPGQTQSDNCQVIVHTGTVTPTPTPTPTPTMTPTPTPSVTPTPTPSVTPTPSPTPTVTPTPSPTPTPTGPACSNGRDDDNDGFVDGTDSGCHTDGNPNNPNSFNPNDTNEDLVLGQCSDSRDNDLDGATDGADSNCHSDGNPNNPASFDPTASEFPTVTPTPIVTPTPTPNVTPAPPVIIIDTDNNNSINNNNVNNNENTNVNNVNTGAVNVTTGHVDVETESQAETGEQRVDQDQDQHQTTSGGQRQDSWSRWWRD